MLYSRSLLVVYCIYSTMYIFMPNSLFILHIAFPFVNHEFGFLFLHVSVLYKFFSMYCISIYLWCLWYLSLSETYSISYDISTTIHLLLQLFLFHSFFCRARTRTWNCLIPDFLWGHLCGMSSTFFSPEKTFLRRTVPFRLLYSAIFREEKSYSLGNGL